MSSIKKKKKNKNARLVKAGLKHKGKGIKKLNYYTSSQRRVFNKNVGQSFN